VLGRLSELGGAPPRTPRKGPFAKGALRIPQNLKYSYRGFISRFGETVGSRLRPNVGRHGAPAPPGRRRRPRKREALHFPSALRSGGGAGLLDKRLICPLWKNNE